MDEIFQGFKAKQGEHLLLVLLGGAKVPRQEREILGRMGGSGGFGQAGGLFWVRRGGDGHSWENKWGQGVGKESRKVGLKGVGGVSLKPCTKG